MPIHFDTTNPDLDELKKYYECQQNYAEYPLEIRLRAIDGAAMELKNEINVEDNFQFLRVIWRTLGI